MARRKKTQQSLFENQENHASSEKNLENCSRKHEYELISGETIHGKDITLNVLKHDTLSCYEFTVSSPKFSFPRWLFLTAVFNAIGFVFNLHKQDQFLMTIALAVLLVILLLKIHLKVKKESLLVMSTLGVQLTTTFASGRTTSNFIDCRCVRDLIINEAVTMHSVIFYLCLLIQPMEDSKSLTLLPLFTQTWPRLSVLKRIHKRGRPLIVSTR